MAELWGVPKRVFVNLGAIACWIMLWGMSAVVGWKYAERVLDPEGLEGYAFLTAFLGILFISPLGLWCSTFFLRKQRHIVLFILCGIPVGLAITLWPLLPLPDWAGPVLVVLAQVVPLGALVYWLRRHL